MKDIHFKRWIPPVIWMSFIFLLSSIHGTGAPLPIPDYVLHFLNFFVLATLLWWATALDFSWGWAVRLLVLLAVAVGYGLTDEFHQIFVPGREASVADLIADAGGSLFGLLLLTHPKLTFFRSCLLRRKPAGQTMGVNTSE